MLLVPLLYLGRVSSSDVTPNIQVATADGPAKRGSAWLSEGWELRATDEGRSGTEQALGLRPPVPVAEPDPSTTTTSTSAPPATTTTSTSAPPTTVARPAGTVAQQAATTTITEPPSTTVATTVPPTTTTSTTVPPTTTTTRAVSLSEPHPAGSGRYTNRDTGVASWFNAPDGTCAHTTIARGTIVRITRVSNGVSTTCMVDQWGPADTTRIIDLSMDTFEKLAPPSVGLIEVVIEW